MNSVKHFQTRFRHEIPFICSKHFLVDLDVSSNIKDSEIEDDDETEIIYQKFLENHEKKSNEKNKKENEETVCLNLRGPMCNE